LIPSAPEFGQLVLLANPPQLEFINSRKVSQVLDVAMVTFPGFVLTYRTIS